MTETRIALTAVAVFAFLVSMVFLMASATNAETVETMHMGGNTELHITYEDICG
ncbi:MAG: hypothetical protein RIC14_00125 [Filomicrobium sp.]